MPVTLAARSTAAVIGAACGGQWIADAQDARFIDDGVRDRLRAALSAGNEFYGETINYRKDGTTFPVELHVTPVRDERGRVSHFVAIQRDAVTTVAVSADEAVTSGGRPARRLTIDAERPSMRVYDDPAEGARQSPERRHEFDEIRSRGGDRPPDRLDL